MPKIKKIKDSAPKDINLRDYAQTLANLKHRIREAQIKSMLSVNKELLGLYWDIGETIVQKQERDEWGSKTIEKLAQDLQEAFPGVDGFSPRNIFRMRAFYLSYQKVTQPVSQLESLPILSIPWGHNIVIFQKLKDINKRLWYAQKTIENGWSRRSLESAILSDAYSRDGKALTNFVSTLPEHQSYLAQQTLKDPFIFDFLQLPEEHIEQDIEHGLVNNIQKTLLEFGKGFAFVGRQVNVGINGKDRYVDLLFYNINLHCYVVIELKARDFDPKDTGQISYYLAAVDNLIKGPQDNPTIGLLLCREKDKITVEWTLGSNTGPIAVASYFTKISPKDFKRTLPTVEEIERELQKNKILSEMEEKQKAKKKDTKVKKKK